VANSLSAKDGSAHSFPVRAIQNVNSLKKTRKKQLRRKPVLHALFVRKEKWLNVADASASSILVQIIQTVKMLLRQNQREEFVICAALS
jgi:hypothetical protein